MSDDPETTDKPEASDKPSEGVLEKLRRKVTPAPKPEVMATEPEPMVEESEKLEAPVPAVSVTLEKKGVTLADTNPTMARKHADAVQQKRPGQRKYFRNRPR